MLVSRVNMDASNAQRSQDFLGLIERVRSDYGLAVMVLVALNLFLGFVFWKMIWNVWSAAMRAKDEEIDRLVKERDKYQELVFGRLESSRSRLLDFGQTAIESASLVDHKRDGSRRSEQMPKG